jgi:imidazolonepropionase-like amidohydrolase
MRSGMIRSAVLASSALFSTTATSPAQTIAITGGTVIDATGRAPIPDGVVVIESGKIKAVGPVASTQVPSGITRVDARGKYVIPGLMDANLHLYLNGYLEELIRFEGRYHEVVLEGAQIALKTGQTTVFDTWGPRADLAKVRDMINAGQAVGSRIFLAGNIIGFSGPLGPDFFAPSAGHATKAFVKRTNERWEEGTGRELLWMPPDTLRQALRKYASSNIDFLKFGASGHVDMNFVSFSERQMRVIVEEGHRAGKTVQTHTTSPESLDMAIEAGVDIITHGDISGPAYAIPAETLKKLVERNISVSVLPITKRSLDLMVTKNPGHILTPYMTIAATNIRNMVKAGVKLMVSTDAGVENPVRASESPTLAADSVDSRTKLGEGHFNALVSLEEAGMAPMEVLKSATSNIAKAYKVDRELGTLEVGKAGDLVILDADPLASARNYRRINSVIKGGKVIDLASLPTAPVISTLKP